MRRVAVVLAALALLLSACGGQSRPSLHVTPLHRLTACASSDCGAYAVTLTWGVFPPWGHTTTGYNVFCTVGGSACNGTPYGTTAGMSFAVSGMDCGKTFTLGVQAHDSATPMQNTSYTASTPYTTPSCPAGGQTTNCFSGPHACGYPEPGFGTVGSTTACGSLTTMTSGNVPAGWSLTGVELQPTSDGTSGSPNTLSGFNIPSYWIFVGSHSHIKLENDCITVAGSTVPSGDPTVWQSTGTDLTVDHVTMIPAGCSAAYNTTSCSTSFSYTDDVGLGASSAVTNSLLADAEENIGATSNDTITGNYIVANGVIGGSNHTENVYTTCSQRLTITGNTLINPWDQTADIFGDTTTCGGACSNQFDIESNLMAGGGEPISWCSSASANGTGTLTFKNNDLARCSGTSTFDATLGGHYCSGGLAPENNTPVGSSIGAGQDTHGYWPLVGFFGLDAGMLSCPAAVTWTGNFFDDNGASVGC